MEALQVEKLLLEHRTRRVSPQLDDKILTGLECPDDHSLLQGFAALGVENTGTTGSKKRWISSPEEK